jgi:GTPase
MQTRRGLDGTWRGAHISPQCSHNHEILTGRTSTLNTEVLGFDGHGKVVNYQDDGAVATVAEVRIG